MIKITCKKCNKKKNVEEFQSKNKTKGTIHSWCANCLNEQKKKHYNENKNLIIEKIKKRKEELRDFVKSFKKECTKCGYNKTYWALDFHHKDPSEKEELIGKTVIRGWSKERIKKEIDKCIVVCKNCHAEIHAPLA